VKCSSEETFGLLISKVEKLRRKSQDETIVLLIFSILKVYLITSCMSYIHLIYMFSLNYSLQWLLGFGNSKCYKHTDI